jgi:methyltransferase (TIGR00027 family)
MAGIAQQNTDVQGEEGVAGGVGLTALMVAAARAIETHRQDSLAQDDYAEHFVLAAPACAGWPVRIQQVPDGDANPLWGRFARYFGLRTRVFDDFLLGAVNEGARQVVLLGAGLDARAFRLDWPSGCVIYEIDREGVLAYKHEVLNGLSASPKAARVPIAIDLREDWVGALIGAGFDAAAPSAWLAEGLLFYLPNVAERLLIDAIDRLAAAGSALAFEVKIDRDLMAYRDSSLYTSTRRQIGIDLLNLFEREPRPDSAADLAGRGWSTTVRTPFDFTHRLGRGPLPEENDALAGNRWVFADRARGEGRPHSFG